MKMTYRRVDRRTEGRRRAGEQVDGVTTKAAVLLAPGAVWVRRLAAAA